MKNVAFMFPEGVSAYQFQGIFGDDPFAPLF